MARRKNEATATVSDLDLQARVRQHLAFLGLTHTLETLDAHLATATRESSAAGVATSVVDHEQTLIEIRFANVQLVSGGAS